MESGQFDSLLENITNGNLKKLDLSYQNNEFGENETSKLNDQQLENLCEALKDSSVIKNLNLRGNYIRDDGAKHIADMLKVNTSIQVLDLAATMIGDDGACLIAEALQVNRTLRELNLYANMIENVGAEMISRALLFQQSLRTISLGYNRIGNSGITKLGKLLFFNKKINLLILSNNLVSQKGATKILSYLMVNTSKTYIDLSQHEKLKKKYKDMEDLGDIPQKIRRLCQINQQFSGNREDVSKLVQEKIQIVGSDASYCFSSYGLFSNLTDYMKTENALQHFDKIRAFHIACIKGELSIAKHLFYSEDINLDALDEEENTALHLASLCDQTEIVEWLLSEKADTSIPNCYYETPLILACKMQRVPIAKALIKHGCSVDMREKGKTALELALEYTMEDVAIDLVMKGATYNDLLMVYFVNVLYGYITQDGKTVAEYAKDKGMDDFVRVLEKKESCLECMPWFFEGISKNDAERFLRQCNQRSFLVRNSSIKGCYTLSIFDGTESSFCHVSIGLSNSGRYHIQDEEEEEHSSVVNLISVWSRRNTKYQACRRNGKDLESEGTLINNLPFSNTNEQERENDSSLQPNCVSPVTLLKNLPSYRVLIYSK